MPAGFKNSRQLWTNGQDPNIPVRLLNLENNEYKITYYEIISGASGSLTLPGGATINAGEFGLSGNCILSKIDGSNKPTFESPTTSGGTIVTASLNVSTGAWVASGTYTDTDVALIYSIKIKAVNYGNLDYDFIIETIEIDTGVQSVTGPNVDNTDPANPVVNNPTLQQVTDNGANTTNQMQINGVNVATVNDIPSLSGYVDTAGLTTNTIPKATASDTIGDSSITDDGTKVNVNGGFYATTGAAEILIFGDTAYMSADQQSNTNIESNLLGNEFTHNVKNTFNAPANNFPQLTASQIVETDASKNLVSVSKGTAYNKDFGTAAGTVLEGNRITQVITDGVTDKAPSEDAVFDALALRIPQNSWVDISGTATIVGWSSYTYNKIQYKDLGDSYCIDVYISGTSNSGLTTIQLPFTLTSNHGSIVFVTNNGVSSAGRVICLSTATLDFRSSPAAAGWTASGLKQVSCNFTIKK